jgi:hypothetical protein
MLDGIDLSFWQSTTPDLAPYDFVIVRASVGLLTDSRWLQHATAVRRAGKVLGAYHFGVSGDVGGQVDTLLRGTGEAADFYALDLEDNGSRTMADAEAAAFIRGMHKRGWRCGLYHSSSGYPHLGQDWAWIADWSGHVRPAWTFWQYRGAPLDLDRFNGDTSALREFIAAQHIGGRHVTATLTPLTDGPIGRVPAGTRRFSAIAPYAEITPEPADSLEAFDAEIVIDDPLGTHGTFWRAASVPPVLIAKSAISIVPPPAPVTIPIPTDTEARTPTWGVVSDLGAADLQAKLVAAGIQIWKAPGMTAPAPDLTGVQDALDALDAAGLDRRRPIIWDPIKGIWFNEPAAPTAASAPIENQSATQTETTTETPTPAAAPPAAPAADAALPTAAASQPDATPAAPNAAPTTPETTGYAPNT